MLGFAAEERVGPAALSASREVSLSARGHFEAGLVGGVSDGDG